MTAAQSIILATIATIAASAWLAHAMRGAFAMADEGEGRGELVLTEEMELSPWDDVRLAEVVHGGGSNR